jgi:hypothetical protein
MKSRLALIQLLLLLCVCIYQQESATGDWTGGGSDPLNTEQDAKVSLLRSVSGPNIRTNTPFYLVASYTGVNGFAQEGVEITGAAAALQAPCNNTDAPPALRALHSPCLSAAPRTSPCTSAPALRVDCPAPLAGSFRTVRVCCTTVGWLCSKPGIALQGSFYPLLPSVPFFTYECSLTCLNR